MSITFGKKKKKKWDETGLVSNTFHEILPKLPDKLLSFCNTRKENTVLNRLHIGHLFDTFLYFEKGRGSCLRCMGAVITVKDILIGVLICWRLERNIWKRDLCIHSFRT